MVTLQEAKDFLRIDGNEEDALITQLITAGQVIVKGAVSDHDTKMLSASYVSLAKTFLAMYINDIYSNRSAVSENDQQLSFAAKSMLSAMKFGVFA